MLTQKYKQGDHIWLQCRGNRDRKAGISEAEILSAGEDYYTVDLSYRACKFTLEGTQAGEYLPEYELWDSREAFEQDKLRFQLEIHIESKIRNHSTWAKEVCLADLAAIAKILKIEI